MIGQAILHYKILAKLGEGGMGVVYKAEDTKLKREVAIKFLSRHIAASAEERERFKIEAQAAAALNHPNIATIHAIEEIDDDLFIVMEFIEGKELKQLIIDNSQLTIDNCLAYATQIAEGLKAAHAKGITHRDIKSSNIMVTDSGQVKIMDFGLAKMGGGVQLTKKGTTFGTVAYMSPEQTWGEPVDQRTDIWSFGVVLYEMLTGRMPFRGDYEQAVIYAILNEEPKLIADLRRGVPMELARIVGKALAKNPDERYQHVSEMAVDLKNLPKGSETAKTKTPPLKATRLRIKRPWLYAGVAILLILLVALISRNLLQRPEPKAKPASIAVLPFVNISADAEKEYFSDGMTEELINALAKVKGLNVVARTSVFQFKGKAYDIRKVGEQLIGVCEDAARMGLADRGKRI
jgi:serine/threonine protein kinase